MPPNADPRFPDQPAALHVSGLAHQVLEALSLREADAAPALCDHTLAALVHAVLDAAPFEAAPAIEMMLERGVPHHDIADRYVPAAARGLGDCWVDSDLDFARVTVASARLQEMLGHLMQPNDLPLVWDRTTPRVVLVSLRGDQHMLGWKLVTVQLRRRGVAVDAAPCVSAQEGAELVERSRCELVLVSASRLGVLESLADMAGLMRRNSNHAPPIVLGGLVAEMLDPTTRLPDIACVTNDLSEALSFRQRNPAQGPLQIE